jgi:hypothetical protein
VTIVFKDLQKLVSQQQLENARKELFQRLQGESIWIYEQIKQKIHLNRDSSRKGIQIL